MPAFSGTFSGNIEAQASLTVADESNHEMLLAQVKGPQQSSDPRWNGATITYSAVLDLANGKGMQRGHFVNAHADGNRSFGSFEGPVAPVGGELRCEGAWTATGGTGPYAGMSGGGKFSMRMTSPKTVETSWDGHYEL